MCHFQASSSAGHPLYQHQLIKCTCLCAYLCPCIYLGPSLQQQSHHVSIPAFGRYVQRCDVILRRKTSIAFSFGNKEKKNLTAQVYVASIWRNKEPDSKHGLLLTYVSSNNEIMKRVVRETRSRWTHFRQPVPACSISNASHLSEIWTIKWRKRGFIWQWGRKVDKYPPLGGCNHSSSDSRSVAV